jgi:hypothetical protein
VNVLHLALTTWEPKAKPDSVELSRVILDLDEFGPTFAPFAPMNVAGWTTVARRSALE